LTTDPPGGPPPPGGLGASFHHNQPSERMPDEPLHPMNGMMSSEAALYVSQLDRLTSTLWKDLSDIEADELEWQPAAGMNTIGMLLAHIAIVEVYWIDTGVRGLKQDGIGEILEIGVDDDGMPLAANGKPPQTLARKDIGWYDMLLVKARAHTHATAASLKNEDMDREFMRRTRSSPEPYALNVRWVFYHLLEHLAGHYGQILMLRHMYRTRLASQPTA
jgi:uncharacterized damage-inducible protein DinB